MYFNREKTLKLCLTAVLLAAIMALCFSAGFYSSTITSIYLSLALFSALIVLQIVRPSWSDLLWAMAGSMFLAVLDYRLMGFHPTFTAFFSFAGLAAFAILGIRTIWAKGEQQKLLLYALVPAVLFVGSEWMASTLLDITERMHPKTLDLFLYSFDCSLRVQISFLMGQLLSKFHWLWWTSFVFYAALPLPLALVYAAHLRRDKSAAGTAMLAFIATGPLGVVLYNVLPACGPVHLFGAGFPWHPPAIADVMQRVPITLPIPGARNAIPSLHMTWVLLIWWDSRGLPRWVRAIALSFVCFTVAATLGTGEHYFVDLIVAFPFSLMVQALCSCSLPFRSQRRTCFLLGALVTLIWLALLSFSTHLFWVSPIIPWSMAVATVSSSVFLWHRLQRTEPLPLRTLAAAAGRA